MDTLLMSMPDIADLAGVRRPVVSTWRRRYADFPPSVVSDTTRPLFDGREVSDWLVSTGRAQRSDVDTDLALHSLGRLHQRLPGAQLISAATALLCLRHLDGRPLRPNASSGGLSRLRRRAAWADPEDRMLRSEVDALGDEYAWLATDLEALVEAAWGPKPALEHLLRARWRLGADLSCTEDVVPPLAQLVAGVCGVHERAAVADRVRVADLSAGLGDLLAAVLTGLAEDAGITIHAQEHDTATARLLRRRMTVAGFTMEDLQVTESLDLEETAPDVVLAVLPYRAGENRNASNALESVADVADLLPAGSTGVVLGPADALTEPLKPGRADTLRRKLLRSGIVEAVISLPGGLMPFRPAYRQGLWVLRREPRNVGAGLILTSDLSDRTLTEETVAQFVTEVVTWRRDGHHPGQRARAQSTVVPMDTVLAGPARLTTPRLREELTAANRVLRAIELEADLADYGRHPHVHSGLAERRADHPALTTIGALLKERRLLHRPGTRIDTAHIATRGSQRILGPNELIGQQKPGTRFVDRVAFAEHYEHAGLTEPGDVVITLKPRLGVLIDHDGFSAVQFPARALRIPADQRDTLTPRVLAALLKVAHSGARAVGSVHEPVRLAHYAIPALSAAEVVRFDALLADLETRRHHVQSELDALDELYILAADGLTDGGLTLDTNL
jgi:hypothetical protein